MSTTTRSATRPSPPTSSTMAPEKSVSSKMAMKRSRSGSPFRCRGIRSFRSISSPKTSGPVKFVTNGMLTSRWFRHPQRLQNRSLPVPSSRVPRLAHSLERQCRPRQQRFPFHSSRECRLRCLPSQFHHRWCFRRSSRCRLRPASRLPAMCRPRAAPTSLAGSDKNGRAEEGP